jgi:hypothetical protein
MLPETQNEYNASPESLEIATVLPEVETLPLVDGEADSRPIPPVCWMVAEHEHPPSAVAAQLT